MRIFLTLIFTLSLFSDLASAAFEISENLSLKSSFSCNQFDICKTDTNDHSSEDDDHCHCHAGHSHLAVLRPNLNSKIDININLLLEPQYLIISFQHFLVKIDRPPIA